MSRMKLTPNGFKTIGTEGNIRENIDSYVDMVRSVPYKKQNTLTLNVSVFQFKDQVESELPEWCSLKGTKLPKDKQEIEFFNPSSESTCRAVRGEYIICTDFSRFSVSEVVFNTFIRDNLK